MQTRYEPAENVKVRPSLLRMVALCLGLAIAGIVGYVLWWYIWYHGPATAPVVIDRRPSKDAGRYCVTLCASLADNPLGFPGHCYVVWSIDPPTDVLSAESAAFLPVRYFDQVPSLWTYVPGKVIDHAAKGNTTNLDMVSVLVSSDVYSITRQLCNQWRTGNFRAGVRDCVSFTNAIAAETGIHTPNTSNVFPQDYIRRLKSLNSSKQR
jgi:hypothetical protein